MNQIIIELPEQIMGLYKECELVISVPESDAILSDLDNAFSSVARKGQMRKPYSQPKSEDPISEIEDWQFNDELTHLSWDNLSFKNAAVLIANFSFLDVNEMLSFQPLMWRYLLYSNCWVEAFSAIIFFFQNVEIKALENFKNNFTIDQKSVFIKCLNRAYRNLNDNNIDVQQDLELDYELKQIEKAISYWSK